VTTLFTFDSIGLSVGFGGRLLWDCCRSNGFANYGFTSRYDF